MTLDLASHRHLHFVGVGGIGMSALAELLLARDFTVSGSDREASEQTEKLLQLGARIAIGHAAENVSDADLVVRTTAIGTDNPEVKAAEAQGIPTIKREELLGAIFNQGTGIAVAGTHGKTTTTALIGEILLAAGLDPTILVGGVSRNLGSNARVGSDDLVVAEADEYHEAFLYLRPSIGVITNVEPEHLDFYGSIDRLENAFRRFAHLTRDTLVICVDDPRLARLVEGGPARTVTYGFKAGDWRVESIQHAEELTRFHVLHPTWAGSYEMQLAGEHNVSNALAALAVAESSGISQTVAREALAGFRGVERRLEIKGEVEGILVVDDYGHHPTEIRTALAALRQRYARPIKLVFQPHTYSRTKMFFAEFVSSFQGADAVYLMDIYAAREEDRGEVNSVRLAEEARRRHPRVRYTADPSRTVQAVTEEAEPGDLIVTMGAGNINKLGPLILETLTEQGPGTSVGPRAATLSSASNPAPIGASSAAPAAASDSFLKQLHEAGIKRASHHEPMARHTSWRIGGPADHFCVAESDQDLRAAIELANQHALPWLILGGGNNILVSDEGIEGLVILNRLRSLAIEDSSHNGPLLACGAGVFFAKAAQFSAQRGYTGLEWGIAIPGTVGGGIVNNAGAHSTEVSKALESAEVLDAKGHVERLSPDAFAYHYRESALKEAHAERSRMVVTACRFHIAAADRDAALNRVEELRQHRLRTQPVKEASAGSTFKNPPDNYAGALIDRAGLKGHRIGDAQIAPLHANFILNLGHATANDVVQLMRLAQESVWDRFGIHLEPEVQLVGRWPREAIASIHTTSVGASPAPHAGVRIDG